MLEAPSSGQAADLLRAIGCVGFVVAAVGLEVAGGYGANSPAPSWAHLAFPIAWPQPARVVWWLVVALAAFGYRRFFLRAGFRVSRVVTVLLVAPFVMFAGGVAGGAWWATWH